MVNNEETTIVLEFLEVSIKRKISVNESSVIIVTHEQIFPEVYLGPCQTSVV